MPIRPLLLCCLLAPLFAADPEVVLPPPLLKVPRGEQAVELASYALAVQVRGLYAQCTATMVFRNPGGRQLEGTLEFALPERAAVSGYALDVAGRMVDGVVVGKDRARVVLEAEERQGVDPGLVEQVRGNRFRTRVAPVPAGGQRTVAVTWVQELAVRGDEAALRVAVPHCRLPVLTLHVEIAAGGLAPRLGGFGNLTLTRWQGRQVADATLRDVVPGDDLLVRLPDLPRRLIQVEEGEGERFVAISDRPELPAAAPLAPPRRLAVAWDASGGRTAEGLARGRAFLAALLARCPGCVVDLVVFRDVPEAPRACADAAALLAAIDAEPSDGGTGLARLDLRRAALPHPDDRCWLLVSDGFGTLGEGLPECGGVPVYGVSGEAERDAGVLRLLAARSGGALLDLLAGGGEEAALAALLAPPPGLLRVEAPAGVLAATQTAFADGRTTLLARLTGDGVVQLVYGAAGQEVARTRLALVAEGAAPGGVIARAWAGARAGELAVFPDAARAELIALGQRYHLVTPGTSLLVLERLDQYVRNGIAPPPTWTEMAEAYQQALATGASARQADGQAHLEQVVGWWRERVAWWQHPPVPVVAPAEPAPVVARMRARAAAAPAAPAVRGGSVARDAAPVTQSESEDREVTASDADGGDFAAIGAGGGASGVHGLRAGGGKRRDRGEPGDADGDEAARSARIALAPFDPATPYLRALAASPPDQVYATYLRERAAHAASPSFYLDCAGFLLARSAPLGRRVLSNLAELRLDDPGLLRCYAWRLQEAGDVDGAVAILRRVLALRPEEPQSYRDLALALDARAELGGRGGDLEEAMALLLRVVLRQPAAEAELGAPGVIAQAWARFPQIEVIALEELNRMIAVAGRRSWDRAPALPPLDERLRQLLDCDLRVVMAWDADATDIDLHVIEPGGEEAFYGHRNTASGGLVSNDLTQGYGPEEYLIHRAASGAYRLGCHFYGSRTQHLLGPATVTALAITDWGRPGEQRRRLTLRLEQQGDHLAIGEITIAGPGAPDAAPLGTGDATVTRDQLRDLALGMHRPEVETRLGTPLRVDQEAQTVLVYRTTSGSRVRLGFGPDLVWAREALDGAERELLPR